MQEAPEEGEPRDDTEKTGPTSRKQQEVGHGGSRRGRQRQTPGRRTRARRPWTSKAGASRCRGRTERDCAGNERASRAPLRHHIQTQDSDKAPETSPLPKPTRNKRKPASGAATLESLTDRRTAPDSPHEADVKLTQNWTSAGTAGTCGGPCRGPNPKTRARSLLPRPRSMATAVRSGHVDVVPETQDGSVQKSRRLVSTLTERRRALKTHLSGARAHSTTRNVRPGLNTSDHPKPFSSPSQTSCV